MSSTNGTNATEEIRELCRLVRECRKSGVRRLKLRDFEVDFTETGDMAKVPGPEPKSVSPGPDAEAPLQVAPQINLFDQSEIQDLEEAQQLIDDPAGFEEDQIREQLETQRLEGQENAEARA